MKKNGDANNNPTLILIIAVIFALGGLILIGVNFSQFQAVVLIIGIVLLAAGVCLFVYGIKRSKAMKAYSELLNDPNAFKTTATFVKAVFSSYSSKSVGVNGFNLPTSVNIYKKVCYSYVDENGERHDAKSVLSYTSNQVEFLKQKGTFNIKCKGNVSAIIEEIPVQNGAFNL